MSQRPPPRHWSHTVPAPLSPLSPGEHQELPAGQLVSPGVRQPARPPFHPLDQGACAAEHPHLQTKPGNAAPQRTQTRAQVHTGRPSASTKPPFSHSQFLHPKCHTRTWLPDLGPNHSQLETVPSSREEGSKPASQPARGSRTHHTQPCSDSSPGTCPSGNTAYKMSGGRNVCTGHCTTVRTCARPTAEVCKHAVRADTESNYMHTHKNCNDPRTVSLNVQKC